VELFRELKALASGSEFVLPSRNTLKKPISRSTLNSAIRTLDADVQPFVLHDFRRTASTVLHENDWPSDVIEKALAHEQGGVRGVYNKAQYAEQRREMLQWWRNFVENQITDRDNVIFGRFGDSTRAAT